MELTFWIKGHMVLYFLARTVSYPTGILAVEHCLHSVKLFFLPSPHSKRRFEGEQKTRRGHSWDSLSKLTNGIFHSIWLYAQQQNTRERRRKDGMFVLMVFALPGNHYLCWGCFFIEVTKYLPAGGKQGINFFALLALVTFVFCMLWIMQN